MISLETDRLIIRNFILEDWQELQELVIQAQALESAQYDDPRPTSREEVQAMTAQLAEGDEFLAVCLKTTGVLIGLVAVNRREEQEGQVHNLGYVFHPGYYRQGYATESCRAVMDYVFGQLAADGILARTHPANERSVALLTRLGLNRIGEREFTLSRMGWLALTE